MGYQNYAVARNLNLKIADCELVALIGRNGIGKSTLLRTIARLQPALSGKIEIAGKPLKHYSRSRMADIMSIVVTDPVNVAHLTVRQLVSLGCFPHSNWLGKLSKKNIDLIEDAMNMTGVSKLANKNLHEISDGERQRAMIARALAQDTELILLDEPTAFLDMPNRFEIVNLLKRLTRTREKTILFSTHDLNIAMQEADKLWLIEAGAIQEGAPEDMALNGQFSEMFEGTKLKFNDNTGQFSVERNNIRQIKMFGEGKNFFWTKKALERLDFSVEKIETENQADITVNAENNVISWTLKTYEKKLQFTSIYDLAGSVKLP